MKTSVKITAIILSLSLLFLLISCDSNKENSSPQDLSSSIENKSPLDSVMTKEAQDNIKALINSIEPEYDYWKSYVIYNDYKEDSDKLSSVGVQGLPIILSELEKIEGIDEKIYRCGFLSEGFNAIARINGLYVRSVTNNTDDRIGYNGYEKKCLSAFYLYSAQEVPKIIATNDVIEAKLEKLREFGLFAVPYVVKEIENGKTEYEAFFVEIGLHLSVPEFMLIFGDPNLPYEEIPEKIRNAEGAEDFDYKQWLSENQADLDAMFKFLDAYVKAE